MKPRLSTRHEAGLTLFEVGVVVAILLILVAVLLPTSHLLSQAHPRAARIICVNNLKQVVLAYRIWEGDNGDIYPMGISVTNGGSMEMVATGDVVQTFLAMSNELSTPKILVCPEDTGRSWPASTGPYGMTGFSGLANSNISYFVGVDVTNDARTGAFLSGDCNFEIRGLAVKSGLLLLWTNDPVAWDATRHVRVGNLGLGDGSVQVATSLSLRNYYLVQTGVATNRLAIP